MKKAILRPGSFMGQVVGQFYRLIRYFSWTKARRIVGGVRHHPFLFLLGICIVVIFTTLIFLFFYRVFGYLLELPDFTRPFVLGFVQRLWTALLSAMAFFILMSGALNGLTNVYMKDENPLLWTLPISRTLFLLNRWEATFFQSTYMVYLTLIPILIAMNLRFRFPFYAMLGQILWITLLFADFVVFGIFMVTLLVRWIPARRLHQLLLVGMALTLVSLLGMIRLMRPERFVHPFEAGDWLELLRAMSLPGSRFLPQSWVSTLLLEPYVDAGWFHLSPHPIVALTALTVGCFGLFALTLLILPGAWTRTQESLSRLELRRYLAFPQSASIYRWLFIKEWWFFSRDPSQWGQLILLAAVLGVYFFNIRLIPIPHPSIVYFVWFLNTAMMGFILTALTARFVIPSFSNEGPAYWIIYSLPLEPTKVFRARWWFYQGIFLVLALGMTLGSLRLIGLSGPLFTMLNIYLAISLSILLTALGLYMALKFRRYDLTHPLQVAMGTPGLLYMLSGFLWIGFTLACVIPWVWFHMRQALWGQAIALWPWCIILAHFSVTAFTVVVFYRQGLALVRNAEP